MHTLASYPTRTMCFNMAAEKGVFFSFNTW